MQTIQDAINKGKNLLSVSIIGIAGLSFLPEIILEKDWDDKLDDIGLAIIGVIGLIWYLSGQNRYKRSALLPILVTIGLALKVMAIIIEFGDKENIGDDFGGLILFVTATIVVWRQYMKADK